MARNSKPAKRAKLAKNTPTPKVASPKTNGHANGKMSTVLALLQRKQGATIGEVNAVACRKAPYSTLTSLRKQGHAIVSSKADGGVRTYRLEA